jgi:hypothetical protein
MYVESVRITLCSRTASCRPGARLAAKLGICLDFSAGRPVAAASAPQVLNQGCA